MMAKANRMRAEGRSFQEIADELSKDGVKVSKAAVVGWLRLPNEVKAPAKRAPKVAPEPLDELADAPEMTPAEFTAWLTGQLRQAQQSADACRAMDDQPGAGRAMRLAAQLAALLQKQHARTADDGDVVRVKTSDMVAAAERARSKLHDLIARLSGEMSK
jgi:hypothetical protein